MNYKSILLATLIIINFSACNSTKDKSKEICASSSLVRTPPMGWNSWNSMGFQINGEELRQVADYMADTLLDYGWRYLVVDAGWYYSPGFNANMGSKIVNPPQNIDEYGRLIPDENKFPCSKNGKGLKPLADYVHDKGLLFGIHIMRGIPWNAVEQDLPVFNSTVSACQIANRDTACEWNHSMLNLIDTAEGSYAYYKSLIQLYDSWDVDFIKADDMARPYHKAEIEMLAKAIEAVNPKIILSLSPGPSPVKEAQHLEKYANMWRVSNDVWDHWSLVSKQFEYGRSWKDYEKEGSWPDLDMLPIGKLRITGGDDWVADLIHAGSSSIKNEYSRLSELEQITLMNYWSMFRSPLFIGGYPPENDDFTLKLITNRDLIEINQHTMNNDEIFNEGNICVWKADHQTDTSITYLAVFNLNDSLTVNAFDFGQFFEFENAEATDIWTGSKLTKRADFLTKTLAPHASDIFKIRYIH